MTLETRLARLLTDIFTADEIRTFLRTHVGPAFVDALPDPRVVGLAPYASDAAERLCKRSLVTPSFIDAWAAEIQERAPEIRALLAAHGPAATTGAPHHTAPAPAATTSTPAPAAPNPANNGPTIIVHGNVTGSTFQAGMGPQTVANTHTAAPPAQPATAAEAIARLRDEVEAIQDLMIAGRKLGIERDQTLAEIRANLRAIIDRTEAVMTGPYTSEALQTAAHTAVAQLRDEGTIDRGPLRKMLDSGITQSFLGSTLIEAIRAVLGLL